MVKNDGNIAEFLSFWYIGMGVLAGIYGAYSLLLLRNLVSPPLFLAPFFISLGLFMRTLKPRYQRFEQRRHEAAGGNTLLVGLATEQPAPDESALVLPLTIRLTPRWTTIFSWSAVLWIPSALYFSLVSPGSVRSNLLLIVFASTAISASVAGCLIWVGYHYCKIEVTEEQLVVQQAKSRKSIKWQDARLFAIFPAHLLSKKAYMPINYELSGVYEIVRWPRVRQTMPFTLSKLVKPTIPFNEYEQQMDALLSVIAAKTHLPLYDLR